jgi:hypothetical protein
MILNEKYVSQLSPDLTDHPRGDFERIYSELC